MISKSSLKWKKVNRILYVLPSVIVDVIFSYARERMWYLFDNYYVRLEYINFQNIKRATCVYDVKEGLTESPKNYYEQFMDDVWNPHSGFFLCTSEQVRDMRSYTRCNYKYICEVLYFPNDAIIIPFNDSYRNYSFEEVFKINGTIRREELLRIYSYLFCHHSNRVGFLFDTKSVI